MFFPLLLLFNSLSCGVFFSFLLLPSLFLSFSTLFLRFVLCVPVTPTPSVLDSLPCGTCFSAVNLSVSPLLAYSCNLRPICCDVRTDGKRCHHVIYTGNGRNLSGRVTALPAFLCVTTGDDQLSWSASDCVLQTLGHVFIRSLV